MLSSLRRCIHSRSFIVMKRIHSFAPIAARWPRVLILGSMPGVESLKRKQYYAHARNAFWPIMIKLLELDPQANYQQRIRALKRAGLALWDVFQCCRRVGSADTAIEKNSEIANKIVDLLHSRASIQSIWFNGHKASDGFHRHITPQLQKIKRPPRLLVLPSTSPANATMSFQEKYRCWEMAMQRSQTPPD